jgi:hypothetical protein
VGNVLKAFVGVAFEPSKAIYQQSYPQKSVIFVKHLKIKYLARFLHVGFKK